MNINNKDLYTKDYYALRQLSREREIIDLLNADIGLIKLIDVPLGLIKERLWAAVNEKEESGDLESLAARPDETDQLLLSKLTNLKIFGGIDDTSVSSKLFTNAFNKLCNRIFKEDRFNDEKYVAQSYIHYWLENNLAKLIAKDNRFSTLDVLLKVMKQTELLHHFYNYFVQEIPEQWITRQLDEWTKTEEEPINILESIRTFDRDYFKGYNLMLLKAKELTPWAFICEATSFSDYVMLNEEFSFKASVLFDKNTAAWITFWDHLKLPVLQDSPFHFIQYPTDIFDIAAELIKQKEKLRSVPSHLALILLKNLFQNSIKITERLSFYGDHQRIKSLSVFERDNNIIAEGQKALAVWKNEKRKLYSKIIDILSGVLSRNDIEEWVFSYKPRSTPVNSYTKTYNEEIESVVEAYHKYSSKIPISDKIEGLKGNFNLQKFNFLISEIRKSNIAEDDAEMLLAQVIKFVCAKDFFWDRTYSPAYWGTIKGIGFLLSKTKKPVAHCYELIDQIRVNHEGWKIEKDFRSINHEAFLLCGIILVLEHPAVFADKNERIALFRFLLNFILQQSRFAVPNADADYQIPLHLLGQVANQVYQDMKVYYEKAIITNLDDVNTVLAILSSERYELNTIPKQLLKERIKIEVVFERRKQERTKDRQRLKRLDDSIKKLKLD